MVTLHFVQVEQGDPIEIWFSSSDDRITNENVIPRDCFTGGNYGDLDFEAYKRDRMPHNNADIITPRK
jgi:hypothetical protein